MLALLLVAADAGPTSAQDAAPQVAAPRDAAPRVVGVAGTDARLDALRRHYLRAREQPGADAAEDALAHARRAMTAAESSRRRGEVGVSERALAIADAALTLADRLAARHRARLALEDAQRREREASQRAEAARSALEQALSARARASTLADGAAGEGEAE